MPSNTPAEISPLLSQLGPSAALRERIYLSTPLILSQLCAILLLLVLTFSLPPCLDGLMPWLLGTVSALFGLIWFVLVTLLPGVWSGISYGLAITFSILISLLLDTAPRTGP